MKLSSSLLVAAGVYADYACCPYDDFGLVQGDCPFSERTAWGDAASEQAGLTQGACKGWEANVDATRDGSTGTPGNYNWGGCGFQRLFPWSGDTANGALDGTAFSATEGFQLDNGAGVLGSNMFLHNDDGIQNSAMPYGRVALNGICKLFIPVAHDDIQYVSIAGVHVKGNGHQVSVGACAGGNDLGCSVFNSQMKDTAGQVVTGTSYCFAVSNPAEGMMNSNGISNGNIAGTTDAVSQGMDWNTAGNNWYEPTEGFGGSDTVADLELEFVTNHQSEIWNNGETWAGYNTAAADAQDAAEDNSNAVGMNFDVVVHFKSTWCQSHWDIVDMQDTHVVGGVTFTEAGFGSEDYPIFATSNTDWPGSDATFTHRHHDSMDKRFEGDVCGMSSPDPFTDLWGTVHTLSTARAACTGFAGNTYASTAGTHKWPNAGSWAGHFSHVFCTGDALPSQNFRIYTDFNGVEPSTENIVLSNFNNDFRRIDGVGGASKMVTIRGNLRQVGSGLTYCSPGHLPSNTATEKCTWNWGFANAHLGDNLFQDPDFAGTGATRTFSAAWGGVETRTRTFDIELRHGNIDIAGVAAAGSYDPNIASNSGTHVCDPHDFCTAATGASMNIVTLTLSCSQPAVVLSSVTAKNAFPTCYMGDELHWSAEYLGSDTGAGSWEQLSYISAWYSNVVES